MRPYSRTYIVWTLQDLPQLCQHSSSSTKEKASDHDAKTSTLQALQYFPQLRQGSSSSPRRRRSLRSCHRPRRRAPPQAAVQQGAEQRRRQRQAQHAGAGVGGRTGGSKGGRWIVVLSLIHFGSRGMARAVGLHRHSVSSHAADGSKDMMKCTRHHVFGSLIRGGGGCSMQCIVVLRLAAFCNAGWPHI